MSRIRALLTKDLLDLRQNTGIFFPAIFTGAIAIVLPLVVAVAIPELVDHRALDPEQQAEIIQGFLSLIVLAPISASMSIAAYAIVGEKQARTLEPLLASPITTGELLAAKVLAALLPAIALTFGCFVVYLMAVAAVAAPRVWTVLLEPRSLGMLFLLGPLAALAALQMAVCVSSRVNDSRSAQQIGALVILPIAVLLISQLTGALFLSGRLIVGIAAVLAAIDVGLAALAVKLFDRESILTRWT